MDKIKQFMQRKNIVITPRRYGVEAMGAMAQGLFCSLLIGTILNTIGTQTGLDFFNTIGGYAAAMAGPAMAIAIGHALQSPPMVLFSLTAVGYASNVLGGAGGPLAVLIIAIIAAEAGKVVSKETKVDILVTPLVTIVIGVALSAWWAPAIGSAASQVGRLIMWATELQPFLMGILVSVIVGIALTLPISSAAICAALSLTGLAGGAALAGYTPNGRICRHVLSRKSLGRANIPRLGHLHAPNGQYCQKSENLDSGDLTSAILGPIIRRCFAWNKTDRRLPPAWVPAAWSVRSSLFRMG